jgi:hypothetical protein
LILFIKKSEIFKKLTIRLIINYKIFKFDIKYYKIILFFYQKEYQLEMGSIGTKISSNMKETMKENGDNMMKN